MRGRGWCVRGLSIGIGSQIAVLRCSCGLGCVFALSQGTAGNRRCVDRVVGRV
jgi:hypothetical protein